VFVFLHDYHTRLHCCWQYVKHYTCSYLTDQSGWVQSLDWTTGLLDWTTGLTQSVKYNSFSAEQKLNFLISSVTSLTLLPTASFLEFLEVKGHVHI